MRMILFLGFSGLITGMAAVASSSAPLMKVQTQPEIAAAMPMAKSILAYVRSPAAAAGGPVTAAKAAMPLVRWSSRSGKPDAPDTLRIDGLIGKLNVSLLGRGRIDQVHFFWDAQGESVPYDPAGALRALGARLIRIGCMSGGGAYEDERDEAYKVEIAGHLPFSITFGGRGAGTPIEQAYFSLDLNPDATIPTPRGLQDRFKAENPDATSRWTATCQP